MQTLASKQTFGPPPVLLLDVPWSAVMTWNATCWDCTLRYVVESRKWLWLTPCCTYIHVCAAITHCMAVRQSLLALLPHEFHFCSPLLGFLLFCSSWTVLIFQCTTEICYGHQCNSQLMRELTWHILKIVSFRLLDIINNLQVDMLWCVSTNSMCARLGLCFHRSSSLL